MGRRDRQRGRERPWLGLRTRSAAGRPRGSLVLDGGPAQEAGVETGDEIVAIDGLRADTDGFEALVSRLVPGRAAELHVFRRDELLRLALTPAAPPRDTCFLTLDDSAPQAALERRRQWLATAGTPTVPGPAKPR